MQPQTAPTRRVAFLVQLIVAGTALVARADGRPATDGADQSRSADQHTVIEVSQGDTAVLQCPSNDEHHRFQFWWMKPDQVIGPGTPLNTEKFRYEVLTGTLYIKQVTPQESGIYTCVCKHLGNISLSARSVQLEIKREWQDLWANDYTVNSIRLAAVFSVLVLILLLLYLFYLTAYKNGNRTLHFREDSYSDEDVTTTDRQMYRKTNIMKENMFQHGIDNPTLQKEVPQDKINYESKS
ncbi:Immunoglobulin subtype,Immunoglobulin-like domain,Immunoglobulin-like fold [Cinara cedri]|uniref:Immunoglobulin subtype,Immunoglobulin-like domain,Immunoglobulin-like fold n=1 Tax=Cinara cedri TaxID=506608 RepID=A0A5E4MH04_9HEMI|nr:Immunoglobulin subtype,Immunoglobulin-like domain,Immunoglobulin-like fold [Cinara cedri]